ncbi:pilus assembly FimT family protein [Ilyobacter polytropus]|uniref:Prepilin-type N-terminal cleavage/methylation domain-containing protein n=1 Tax=Ilyobacter polytropus (strain ATCC 51220 / DSM 2926 / LMG 16218 / CuHBu1) TaxID=572544 RepID=E3H6Y4_ILYPC|nr:type II secretion system protein [Ilyobacter polytropus]ADO82503.1 hypothetical protein Ilyop_0716 [Ilyobacter polytropus DSM 2926]
MKRKGFNLIEMIIVGAIIGLVFLLTAPLVKSFGMVNERIRVQNEVDREFAVVSKFIKKQVRSGKNTRENEKLTYTKSDGSEKTIDGVGYSKVFETETDFVNFSDLYYDDLKKKDDDKEGNVLFVEIPSESGSKYAFFVFKEDENQKGQLIYTEVDEDATDFGLVAEEVLMENVSSASFELSSEGVVTFSIDLDVGEFEGKIKDSIRESAVSRIDLKI